MYERLTSWGNLVAAYRNASHGKRGHPNVSEFECRLEDNLIDLQKRLKDFTYVLGRYDSFYIHEPKRRLISAAPFRDRVAHHALCNVIEPVFEKSFIEDSYANRKGKGTHRALNRCQECARKYRFVLQCDVRQFFPSIDHDILLFMIKRKIKDSGVLWLAARILKSGEGILNESYDMVCFPGDDLFSVLRPRGLPIGNLTSQFWANVYLNPFDQFVKRELGCGGFLRYVDDFLFFADRKDILWRWKEAVEKRLEKFRLTIHAGAQPKPVEEGIPFLGFIVFPERRRLQRRKGIYFQRKLKKMSEQHRNGEIPLSKITESVRGWINHARYGNTVGLRKAVLGKYR